MLNECDMATEEIANQIPNDWDMATKLIPNVIEYDYRAF